MSSLSKIHPSSGTSRTSPETRVRLRYKAVITVALDLLFFSSLRVIRVCTLTLALN